MGILIIILSINRFFRNKYYLIFLFAILLINSQFVFPQDQWLNFTASNDVRDVVFKDGYAWAATTGGLMRIDLENQQFFILNASNSGLPSNNLSCLYIDPDSVMWIGTYGQGIARYNGKEWKSFNVDMSGFKNNPVLSIGADNSGILWIGTEMGIYRYYNGGVHSDWNLQGIIQDIMLDNDGVLWIATTGGLERIKNCRRVSIESQTSKPVPFFNVRNLVQGKDKDVWMLAKAGVVMYRDSNYSRYFIPIYSPRKGEPVSLAFDLNGDKWFGFSNGIARIKNGKSEFFENDKNRPRGRVNRIKTDPRGRVWACCNTGLYVYDTSWSFINTSTSFITSAQSIKIFSDSHKNIWMQNGGNLFFYGKDTAVYFSKGEVALNTYSLTADKNGNLWFGHNDGLTMFTGKKWIRMDTLNAVIKHMDEEIFEKNKDTVWAEKNGKFHLLYKDLFPNPSYYVAPMHIDREDNLWLKADDYLIKYDHKNWVVYDQFNSGIPAQDISALTSDSENNLWIGTYRHGLYEFDGEDFISCLSAGTFNDTIIVLLKNFNDTLVISTHKQVVFIPDGDLKAGNRSVIPTYNCYALTILRDSRGNSWLGTQLGLSEFAPPESRALYTSNNSGLAGNYVRSINEDYDGNLWVLTSTGGVNIFNENTIVNEQRIKDFFTYKGIIRPQIIH